MKFQKIRNIPVFGEPLEDAIRQIEVCDKSAERSVLMADHHYGYSMPIGGVCAYNGKISPSGVGYDIACGNKAVRLDVDTENVKKNISDIMDEIFYTISFGVGLKNKERVYNILLDEDAAWDIKNVYELKKTASEQLGTIGSGNHYVDIFVDEMNRVWVGCHFGSRGFGWKIADYYIKAGGGEKGYDAAPTLLDVNSQLGQEYIVAMKLAGRYAYAGRSWVCKKVSEIIGSTIVEEVHNNHNFAWEEEHFGEKYWVVRKGATPAFPGQRGFVGASMGEKSVILKGVDSEESKEALYSTIHGAGRAISRNRAAGKKKWKRLKEGEPKRLVKISEGEISEKMMYDWVLEAGVELRGAGTDESPHCYKRIYDVLEAHSNTIKILHTLNPIGVAMAGGDTFDPYKD